MGQFQQALVQGGWWDRSLVILLADHGESLGDHGESSHGYFMYQSTLRVPLIVHWPVATSGYAARVGQPGGLIDVAPTILDFLKLPAPPAFEGASLLPPPVPRTDDGRAVYSESMYTRDAFRLGAAARHPGRRLQYIDAPKPELYNLQGDPRELHNRIGENAPMARTLRERLGGLLAQLVAGPGNSLRRLSANAPDVGIARLPGTRIGRRRFGSRPQGPAAGI